MASHDAKLVALYLASTKLNTTDFCFPKLEQQLKYFSYQLHCLPNQHLNNPLVSLHLLGQNSTDTPCTTQIPEYVFCCHLVYSLWLNHKLTKCVDNKTYI